MSLLFLQRAGIQSDNGPLADAAAMSWLGCAGVWDAAGAQHQWGHEARHNSRVMDGKPVAGGVVLGIPAFVSGSLGCWLPSRKISAMVDLGSHLVGRHKLAILTCC